MTPQRPLVRQHAALARSDPSRSARSRPHAPPFGCTRPLRARPSLFPLALFNPRPEPESESRALASPRLPVVRSCAGLHPRPRARLCSVLPGRLGILLREAPPVCSRPSCSSFCSSFNSSSRRTPSWNLERERPAPGSAERSGEVGSQHGPEHLSCHRAPALEHPAVLAGAARRGRAAQGGEPVPVDRCSPGQSAHR